MKKIPHYIPFCIFSYFFRNNESNCPIELSFTSFCSLTTNHCSLVYNDLAIAILYASFVNDLADGIGNDLA